MGLPGLWLHLAGIGRGHTENLPLVEMLALISKMSMFTTIPAPPWATTTMSTPSVHPLRSVRPLVAITGMLHVGWLLIDIDHWWWLSLGSCQSKCQSLIVVPPVTLWDLLLLDIYRAAPSRVWVDMHWTQFHLLCGSTSTHCYWFLVCFP